MATTRDLTWAEVLGWRMTRQFLGEARAGGVAEVVKRLTTVPAWSGDAELTVGLRRAGAVTGDVVAAFERGELIKTFAYRGATHYFVPEDAGTYLALRSIGRQWELKSWRECYRLEAEDWPILRESVRDALSDGPLTQSQLAAAVSATTRFRHLEQALQTITFLKPLAWQGELSLAPERDGEVVVQTLAGTPGYEGLPAPDDAGPRAVLAYLDSYGPATPDNLQYWFGEGLSAGRKNIVAWTRSLVGNGIVEVDVEGTAVLCRADQVDDLARTRTRTRAGEGVRLLPGLDQWVLGPGTADAHVVPPQHRADISRGANVILVGGLIAGTWKITKGVLVATGFNGAGLPQADIAGEADLIGGILGQSLEVQVL